MEKEIIVFVKSLPSELYTMNLDFSIFEKKGYL